MATALHNAGWSWQPDAHKRERGTWRNVVDIHNESPMTMTGKYRDATRKLYALIFTGDNQI